MRGRLDLTGWRYLQGLLAGALTGGALTGAAMGGFYGFVSSAAPDSSIMSLYLGLTVAMVATCVWGGGLILVGTPLWAMFAAGGWRSRPVALGVGGGLSGLVGVGLGANVLVGGLDRSIALQPVSVEGNTGLRAAAGVGVITLREG